MPTAFNVLKFYQEKLFFALKQLKTNDFAIVGQALNKIDEVIAANALDLSANFVFPCYIKDESPLTVAEYYDQTGQGCSRLLAAGARIGAEQTKSVMYEKALLRQNIYLAMHPNEDFSALAPGTFNSSRSKDSSGEKAPLLLETPWAVEDTYARMVHPYIVQMVKELSADKKETHLFALPRPFESLQEQVINTIRYISKNPHKEESYLARDYLLTVYLTGLIDFSKNFTHPPELTKESPFTLLIGADPLPYLTNDLIKRGFRVTDTQKGSKWYKYAVLRQNKVLDKISVLATKGSRERN